jgi:hypothetical protein
VRRDGEDVTTGLGDENAAALLDANLKDDKDATP